eukprot:3843612-Rhodomonas_salina.2
MSGTHIPYAICCVEDPRSACYAVSGTHIAYAAIPVRARCGMAAYAAIVCYGMSGTDLAYGCTSLRCGRPSRAPGLVLRGLHSMEWGAGGDTPSMKRLCPFHETAVRHSMKR